MTIWALVSFTLGWSTVVATFPTQDRCEITRAAYVQHATFLTKYECVEISGAKQ